MTTSTGAIGSKDAVLDELLRLVDTRLAIEFGSPTVGRPLLAVREEGARIGIVDVADESKSSIDALRRMVVDGDEPLGVMVQHAGTLDGGARSIFERLFGALGPGGLYVFAGGIDAELSLDLMCATVVPDGLVTRIVTAGTWTAVVRADTDDDVAFALGPRTDVLLGIER